MAALKEIEQNFADLIKDKALSHAYIFHGDSKTAGEFASLLAAFLENGKWQVSERTLSDARIIDGATEDMGIDTARTFSNWLSLAPNTSQYRTLIIKSAHNFTDQAQNAILKVSEEPAPHALIILVVVDLGALLPTVVSRFQKIYFGMGSKRGNETDEIKEIRKQVETFLMSSPKGRSDMIKEMVKEDEGVDEFVKLLIEELHKKPVEYGAALKHLLYRYEMMNQYNTNRKLQLEAVLPFLP